MNFSMGVDKDRIATYIRWSTEEQSDGTTLEVQLEACKLFTQAQGWTFREDLLFVDEGCSGGSLERPGLKRLRKAVLDGKISCVVVYKLDRLSRSVLDTVKLVLEEWEGVCYIKSTREPIDTTSPTGAIFFYMLASYAEWERSIIKERTMSGKIKRAQQGKNPGFTAPYGYARGAEAGQLVICEHEAALVRRIFQEYISGKGINTIARLLNAAGVRNRKATHWRAEFISRLLGNPIYRGLLRYGLTTATSKAQRKQVGKARVTFDEPRYASVEGAVPAIISEEEFKKAGAVRSGRAKVDGYRARSAEYLLSGIARCQCGSTMRGDDRVGGTYRYYRCCNDRYDLTEPCGCGMIPAEKVEQAVLERVREAVTPENRGMLLGRWEEETTGKLAGVRADLDQAKKALASIDKKRQRAMADYQAEELPAKLYAVNMEKLDQEEQGLKRSLDDLAEAAKRLESVRVDLSQFEGLLERIDSWEALSKEEQKQVLRHAVGRLTVFRKRNGSARTNPNPIEVELELTQFGA